MSTRTFVHRSVAILAGTGAAAALALIPSASHATVQAAYVAAAETDANYIGPTSGGQCDLSSPASQHETTPVDFSHGTKRRSAQITAKYTSSDNGSDQVTVKGNVSSSLTLKKSHNDLRSLDLKTGGSVKISHTESGSACMGTAEALAGLEGMIFTEHKKGTFTLTRNMKQANSVSEFELVNAKTDQPVVLDVSSGAGTSHATFKAAIKPGTYEIMAFCGVSSPGNVILKSAQRTTKVSLRNEMLAVFTPAKKHHH
jgi:hypothetical protein